MDDKRAMDAMTWALAIGLWVALPAGILTGFIR